MGVTIIKRPKPAKPKVQSIKKNKSKGKVTTVSKLRTPRGR